MKERGENENKGKKREVGKIKTKERKSKGKQRKGEKNRGREIGEQMYEDDRQRRIRAQSN